jgi:hypothetical protein
MMSNTHGPGGERVLHFVVHIGVNGQAFNVVLDINGCVIGCKSELNPGGQGCSIFMTFLLVVGDPSWPRAERQSS